jgi:hypothetical protein
MSESCLDCHGVTTAEIYQYIHPHARLVLTMAKWVLPSRAGCLGSVKFAILNSRLKNNRIALQEYFCAANILLKIEIASLPRNLPPR